MQTVPITTKMETGLAHACRIEAAKRNISRSELIRLAVAEMLRQAGRLEVKPNEQR